MIKYATILCLLCKHVNFSSKENPENRDKLTVSSLEGNLLLHITPCHSNHNTSMCTFSELSMCTVSRECDKLCIMCLNVLNPQITPD